MNDLTPTLDFWQQECEAEPDVAFNFGMYAYYLYADQQSELALKMIDRALELAPYYIKAEILKGVIHLSRGEYLEGWPHLEKRNEFHKYGGIQWQKEPTKEKVLIWDNEGFGDFIMYARYLPFVKVLCPNMQVACKPQLEDLIRYSFPDIEVVPYYQEAVKHCPITSLGAVFKTTLETIPQGIPYIRGEHIIHDDRVHGKRIGLHWKTDHTVGERYFVKSIPDHIMQPLIDRPDTVSLHVEDLKSGSFAETAGLAQHLDLVITGDTVIAHLCGALGIRTWILLSHDCDWRWMTERIDSPWYPNNVTLFRQRELNDWTELLDRVQRELDLQYVVH